MNKPNIKQQLRRAFFALTIVGALFTLPSAKAGPPVSASGIFTNLDCVIGNVTHGPNIIITYNDKTDFTGTLTGTVCATEVDVAFPNGSLTINSTGVFTGTVAGRSGTAVFTVIGQVGKASPGGRFGGVGTAVSWVMDQGTGGLAGVHGQGVFGTLVDFAEGPGCDENHQDPCITPDYYDDTFTILYSGQIQLAPQNRVAKQAQFAISRHAPPRGGFLLLACGS